MAPYKHTTRTILQLHHIFILLFVPTTYSDITEMDFCDTSSLCHPPNKSQTQLKSCFCEEDNCWMYNDCCRDEKQPQNSTKNITTTCQRIPNTNMEIYVVNTCPPDWIFENDNLLCNKKVDLNSYNYILDLPFQSKNTNIVYANIYCAKCNDDYETPNNVRLFKALCNGSLINCTENLDERHPKFFKSRIFGGNYSPGELQWYKPHLNALISLKTYFISVKVCPDFAVVDHCAESWTNSTTAARCKAYTGYVKQNEVVYKNKHCAKCNYAFNATCMNFSFRSSNSRDSMIEYYGSSVFRSDFSYTVLLAFSTNDELCPEDQIFDLISDSCIQTSCGRNYEKIEDQCVPKINISYNSLLKPCLTMLTPVSQLDFLINGSIRDRISHKTYSCNEFERFNTTFYHVCIGSSNRYPLLKQFPEVYGCLTMTLLCISLVCLVAHVIIHCIIGKLKTLPGKNQFNLCVSLFMAQLLFLVGINNTEIKTLCFVFAVAIHFFYLAVFFWMNVIAFDIYKIFAKPCVKNNEKSVFWFYMLYAWISPLFIVCFAVVSDLCEWTPNFKPIYGYKMCWISSRFALFVFFALPIMILLIENVFLFTYTAFSIRRSIKSDIHLKKSNENCSNFLLYLKLVFIMGGTWIVGLLANFSDYEPLWYSFIILNASQGTFIFLLFTLKRDVMCRFCTKVDN